MVRTCDIIQHCVKDIHQISNIVLSIRFLCDSALSAATGEWVGQLQDLQVWSQELSMTDLVRAMRSSAVSSNASSKVLHWRFSTDYSSCCNLTGLPEALVMQDAAGRINDYFLLNTTFVQDTPSLNPALPCQGPVYPNIWFFAAPVKALGAAAWATYGGRLQFSLMSPSWNGKPRTWEDTVILRGAGGKGITVASQFGRSGADWTYHTLRLDSQGGKFKWPHHRFLAQRSCRLTGDPPWPLHLSVSHLIEQGGV